jgi:hypothetical protein
MPSVDWNSRWGNYLVANRSLENFRDYGTEAGELTAQSEWDEFVFHRDARDLALTPKFVLKKALDELEHELRLYGSQSYSKYRDQTAISDEEQKARTDGFVKAYSRVMSVHVNSLIPSGLWKNLDLFCALLGFLLNNVRGGDGTSAEFGFQLGARKPKAVEPPPEPPKKKPTRKELRKWAIANARLKIESAWKRFKARKTAGYDFRVNMIHYGVDFEGRWEVSDQDRDYFHEILEAEFKRALGEKALELAPASAWENANLICRIYDKLLSEERRKKEFVPSGEERPDPRMWISQREGFEEQEKKREWEREVHAKVRKEVEREMRDERRKASSSKLSGPDETGIEALVIVHLSSLDAYTAHAGPEEGRLLGERLAQAILTHNGPVIIVDQGWEGGRRESRPREMLLEEISSRQDIAWIRFDEAEESWDDFFPRLFSTLDDQGATSAVVGGIWYDDSLHTGCATFTYLALKERMPAQVDPSLVGCE